MIKQMSIWGDVMHNNNITTLNEVIEQGKSKYIINLAETLHEHNYAAIADEIAHRGTVKLVLIAGPSSSGKTTSSKRLALHMRISGLNPIIIAMDDYFKNRIDTPRDENGDYDFECLEALDVAFLNKQLNQLFSGEEIEVPRYDFTSGERKFVGDRLRMKENDVLIMEGIHGLNPALTSLIPDKQKFKIYVSVLTPLEIDQSHTMDAADYRLLRRMVRDNQFRGTSAEETILRWHSVRSGESKYILPFKKEADTEFNSALFYEMPMLKCYAEPLLQTIRKNSPAYGSADRLLAELRSIIALTPVSIRHIPPTSIVREFIGGSSFSY